MAPIWGTLGCYLGLLVLDQCLVLQGAASCPATSAQYSNLSSVHYQPALRPDANFYFISGIVQSFLGTVQPNPFPKQLIQSLVNITVTQEPDTIRQVLRYETGFLVCLAIGLLYLLLVPLVGLCLACCRCCGRCGGRMYQKQSHDIHQRRRGLLWAAVGTAIILLTGNVCMFQSNQLMDVSLKQSPQVLGNAVDNLQIYLTTLTQQIHTVVNESYLTIDKVAKNLTNIGLSLGTEIQSSISEQVSRALVSVHNLSVVVNVMRQDLVQLNDTLHHLQPQVMELKANLRVVKNSVNQTLHGSNQMSVLDSISLDADFTMPNLNALQSAADRADFDSQVKEGWKFLQTIPQQVFNQTGDTVHSILQQLEQIKLQISNLFNGLPLQGLTSVYEQMKTVRMSITNYSTQFLKVERYRWALCLVLCCAVLLVVLCSALGLLLGPLGLQPNADPTKRSDTANCGGLFLLAGAGFSFLFGCLFMLLVMVLFLVGGNMYTLVCVPWQSQELFQIIDTPGIIPGFSLSTTLQLKTNLTLSKVYSDCHQNMPLWSTLQLGESFNLDQFLNISKYTEEMQKNFEKNNITVSTANILTSDLRMQLQNFSKMAEGVNFSNITQQIYNFSSTNLNITAGKLDELAQNQVNASVATELRKDADALRAIQNNVTVYIIPLVHTLNSTVQALDTILSQINGTVRQVLTNMEQAQNFLNSNTSQIVKSISCRFIDCQMGYFTSYADWANRTITQEVGRCGPVAGVIDTVGVLVCSYLVESLNAFWFSLGWCVIFFIPSIILSVKLAKFYRRMKYTDVCENHIQMAHIPRATIT
ncbi:prominin-1-A-like [Arapaima gigas]